MQDGTQSTGALPVAIKLLSKLLIISISLVLAACSGGGGGGGGDGDGGPVTVDKVTTNIYTNDTYTDAEVSIDSNGDSIVRTKLAILFKASATQEQVEGLLTRINATITASIAGARSVSIRIPDPGTVDALEAIIDDIESETFVEAVLKSIIDKETAVPDNVDVATGYGVGYIEHHAAVGGTAAWNAREAIQHQPSIILMDFFGAGSTPLTTYLDANLTGNVAIGHPEPSDHGYHVAGIMTALFGGNNSAPGVVTGMMPDRSNLSIIDLKNNIATHDSRVLALTRAASFGGTVVMNTSLGYDCLATTTSNSCREKSKAMQQGIVWADLVRAAGMETRLFHTKSAGNRGQPAPDMRDTQTNHPFSTAATMTDMTTSDGTPVPPLTNTMVVERLEAIGSPHRVNCLHNNSFVGGHISAIGTDVLSLEQTGNALMLSGTSMAAPQVAGLAAYMLSIDNTLTPQDIKEILLETAQPVSIGLDASCSDWSSAAPAINAYNAVLALDDDSALSGSRSNAPVRNAILDVSNNGTTRSSNGQFDEFDLMYFIQEIDIGTQEKSNGAENVKYSRVDLNGDGYDGGKDGYKKKFNLDIDYPPTYTTVTRTIEGEVVEFSEASLSDDDILCYYAYSPLYTGSETQRTNLMGSRCKPSNMAIYYYHFNDINFPGLNTTCGNTNEDVTDERETFSQRPDFTGDTLPQRPESQFWQPGESRFDQFSIDAATVRSEDDPNGANNNCDRSQSYYAASELTSTLAVSDTDNIFNIDISATSASECWNLDPDTPTWECSNATTRTSWVAEYDFKIRAATNLNLILNFNCTGANMVIPGFPGTPQDVTFTILRADATGNPLPTNRDPSRMVAGGFYACNDFSPIVNVQQLIQLDEPETAGDTDRVIITVTGGAGAFGHLGNALYLADPLNNPQPNDGRQTNITTMIGAIQLAPAN